MFLLLLTLALAQDVPVAVDGPTPVEEGATGEQAAADVPVPAEDLPATEEAPGSTAPVAAEESAPIVDEPVVGELAADEPVAEDMAAEPAEKPRRHKLPQSPFAHTDFTAYTLEKGETRIGLASISYGLTPGLQLTTAPVLDLVGIYNIGGKGEIFHQGKVDGAILGNVYVVPITDLLNGAGAGDGLAPGGGDVSFESTLTWVQMGGRVSFQVAKPWSIHVGSAYARVTATGDARLGRLPSVEIPELGTIGGGQVRLIGALIGEVAQVSFATDYRLNRRDSIIFQFTTPLYYGARAQIDAGDYTDADIVRDLTFSVGYGKWVPLDDIGITSIAWQFSWNHFELRAGIGLPPSNPLGWLQAFNLTYRFGGETRKDERGVRKDYRSGAKSERIQGGPTSD